ncbi:MAG: hypothetical protein LBT40_08625 [Deltaproteobacteria bacterium]|nr:hypothetical protein [Deltaproteobacteria bacterium]
MARGSCLTSKGRDILLPPPGQRHPLHASRLILSLLAPREPPPVPAPPPHQGVASFSGPP